MDRVDGLTHVFANQSAIMVKTSVSDLLVSLNPGVSTKTNDLRVVGCGYLTALISVVKDFR